MGRLSCFLPIMNEDNSDLKQREHEFQGFLEGTVDSPMLKYNRLVDKTLFKAQMLGTQSIYLI